MTRRDAATAGRAAAARDPASGSTYRRRRDLFNEIVRPVVGQLRGVTRLVVVPDATYQDASFRGACGTHRERRFLVEDVSLTTRPSVGAVRGAERSLRTAAGRSPTRALDGRGTTSDATPRDRGRLSSAPSSLTGTDATRARFFADAPSRHRAPVAAPGVANASYPAAVAAACSPMSPGRRYSGAVLGRDIAQRTSCRAPASS